MQYNCIIDSCNACRRARNVKDKAEFRAEVAALVIDRIQLFVATAIDTEEENQAQKTIEHGDLMEFLIELEETCFICSSHGAKLAMVAHEVEKHMHERIDRRKAARKEVEELLADKPKVTRPKLIDFATKKAETATKPGPYKQS